MVSFRRSWFHLAPGAQLGVMEALSDRRGALWVKQGDRMFVRISGDVKAAEPGVILSLSDRAAESLLAVAGQEGVAAVRRAVREQIRAGELRAQYLKTSRTLWAEGIPEFLRRLGAWDGGPPFELDEDPVPAGYRLLDPRGWTVTASSSSGDSSPEVVLDGSQETAWQSGVPMARGMWLQVDFGRELEAGGVELLNPREGRQDYPRGLAVAASRDGVGWEAVARASWLGHDAPGDGDVWVAFGPVSARFLRLRQTEQEQNGRPIGWWGSVGELRVCAPGEG